MTTIFYQKRMFRIITTLAITSALIACDNKGNMQTQTPPTVTTIDVVAHDIPVNINLPGRVAASVIAEVRPQVGGIILEQAFKEGSAVEKGMPLYKIDSATYEASLAQAGASLNRAKANQNTVQVKANRLRQLVKSKAVSKQEVDDIDALLLQSNADVLSATAVLKAAQINVDYTTVKAPITGQIGRSTVTQGALVTPAQANPLATIQQLDPMKVHVTYPSSAFAAIKQSIKDGKVKSPDKLSVTLILENGKTYEHTGHVTFTDPTVDPTTGTILIQAEVPNPDKLLLPGMFVSAVINQGAETAAIAIPQKAVSRDSKGQAVVTLVTKEGDVEKIAPHIVVTSRSQGDLWVIESGLSVGDKVMVEGFGYTSRMPGGRGVVVSQDANSPKVVKDPKDPTAKDQPKGLSDLTKSKNNKSEK